MVFPSLYTSTLSLKLSISLTHSSLFSFVDMASNFTKHRLPLLKERETTISEIVPDPTQAVEKASLTAVPASPGDATPSADTLTGVLDPLPNKNDKGKGKKVVSSRSKGKRAHEGAEVEGSKRKRRRVLI